MDKKTALLFCIITIFIVSCIVFVANQRIDFPTLFFASKVAIPAGGVAYILGFLIGRTIEKSKGVTDYINAEVQQQYVDDLLLKPEQVLNSSPFIIAHSTEEDNSIQDETNTEEEFKSI